MKYAQTWHREISANTAKILISLCILVFLFYQIFIFVLLRAEILTRQGRAFLKKAERLGSKGIIVEQAVFYKRALRILAQAIRSNPLDASTNFAFAEAINSKINQDEQLARLAELEDLNPTGGKESLGSLELVRLNYIEAAVKNPTNAIYHQRLGSVYEKLSQDIQAEAELKKATLLDPQNVSIHLYLAQYYLSRNKQREFDYHLGRVVELYKLVLTGGGPVEHLARMVCEYLTSINREELIKQ